MAFDPDAYLTSANQSPSVTVEPAPEGFPVATTSPAVSGFDPDAYLKSVAPPATAFDPDAYLKNIAPQATAPTEPQGFLGKAKQYIGEQADILGADLQIGAINTGISIDQMKLAALMELQETRLAQYGNNPEIMPPDVRKDFLETGNAINKNKLSIAESAAKAKDIELKTGVRASTKEFRNLPQNPIYQNEDFLGKSKMVGEAFIKDPIGIITDLGLTSLPQSLAVASTAVLARTGQLSATASAAAGGTASAMMEFGGEYSRLRDSGMNHKEAWEKAGVKSGVIGLFDGLSFKTAGNAAGNVIRNIQQGAVKETAKTVAKETAIQGALGASGEALGSVAIGQPIDPSEVAAEAIGEIFGAPGEAVGTYRAQPKPMGVVPPAAPVTAPITQTAPVEQVVPPSISQDTAAMLAETEGKPLVKVPTPETLNTAAQVDQIKDVVIQNRNRATPASISQMNQIAANPDYDLVGFSKDFGTGAPVVAGDSPIPEAQLGRKSTVTASDGRKIPVQYAVIDARAVLPSNNVDGSVNSEFFQPDYPGLRAIAGNARSAGLQAAYDRNTAGKYKEDLTNDDLHGISSEAIKNMAQPVLVRVMPKDQVTNDIGDISNVASNLNLSAVEQAKNDSNRIDLAGIRHDQEGNLDNNALRGFINSMPNTEQANLIDNNGLPTKQATERLNAAIFQKAYNNDDLTRLAYQADDSEARNIIRALSSAAPQMSRLDGAGEFDIRPQLIEAAQLAVNARRNGVKLSDLVNQQDMTVDPLSNNILQLFADNARSFKKIASSLQNLSNLAFEQTQKPAEDIFGETPKMTREELVTQGLKPTEEEQLLSQDTADVEASAKSLLGGKVLFQKGNLGLFEYFDDYGGPHYGVAVGRRYWKSQSYLTNGKTGIDIAPITPEEKAMLQQKVDAIEAEDAIKHAKAPFIKYQNGIAISGGVPKNVGNVVRAWKNLLGIKANVYITTQDFVEQNKDNFTGPHRDIQASLGPKMNGAMKLMSDGSYYIVFKKSTSTTKMLETIAHELGHVHQKEMFTNASPEMQKKLQDAHLEWLASQKNATAKELLQTLRAKTTAQTTIIRDPKMMGRNLPAYWTSFSEWYADQVARWAVSSEKPLTVVDKFFVKLGAALRKFYETLKGQKYLPNETFKQYLDEIAARAQFESLATEKASEAQMALFSRSEMEAEGPKGIEKLNRIRRNYRGEVVSPTNVFSIPDDSKMERFIYKIQDKYIDTKRVIQAIIAQGKEITDKWNAYLKEELYHGRTAKRTKDFLNNELLPVVRSMLKQGISIVEFDTYLQARHAEERNIQIAKINPEFLKDGTLNPNAMPDGGSGMFTKDAQNYLKNLPPEKAKALEELAKKIDAIVKGTQQVLIDAGLESQATIDVWNNTYKKYVPLMRKDLDFAQDYTGLGQGFQTRGGASKRAFGSFKEVADIFANIANQRERAIVRAEKARVGTALYGLAIMNANPDFWLPVNPDAIKNEKALFAELRKLGISEADAANIIQEPQTAVLDPDTGTVTYKVNPILRNSPNVFAIRINGQERFIFFNASDPRAMRMVQAIKNLDAEEMGWALGNASKVTRWIASVNTQYNPVFGAYNFIRDTLGAQFNLSTTAIAGKQAQVTAGVFPALMGIYSDLRAARAGKGVAKGEWAKLWEEYQQEGGATGYRDQFSKNRSDQNVIEKEMRNLEKGNVKKGVAAVFNWLSDYNDAMENAVRLSAYKVAIDQGISKEQSASIAKNLTVNFNRKGERAQQMGALYAFYNASVQGTARLAETLRGPAGKKIVAGGLLLGSVQALALAMMGFKDDEPPEFIKARNLVIPFPDGHYIAIPMPLGLHIIPNMGRITTEMVMNGGKDAGKKATHLAGVLMDAFNPIGNAGLSMQSLSPTMLDPIAAIIENKDTFGRPIAREDRATNPTPGYTRARETASYLGKELSYFLNLASGGTKYQKGLVSPTPDQIDFLVGQATGGVGREISKVEQTVTATVTGEELPTYKVPLVGKFYGDVQSQAAQANRFYDNVTRMANYENEIKGRRKDGVATADFFRDHPEARLWQQANRLENQISTINREKKDLLEKNAPAVRIKQLDERKTRIMTQFNNQVESLEK